MDAAVFIVGPVLAALISGWFLIRANRQKTTAAVVESTVAEVGTDVHQSLLIVQELMGQVRERDAAIERRDATIERLRQRIEDLSPRG